MEDNMKPTPVYPSSITTVRGVLTPEYLRSKMAPYRVPLETADQIVHYIHNGVPPGSFVRAVLENDLIQAVRKGDLENRAALSRIVEYLYCTCPTGAWMSEAQVEAWLGAHRLFKEMADATAVKDRPQAPSIAQQALDKAPWTAANEEQADGRMNRVDPLKLSKKMREISLHEKDRKTASTGERDDEDLDKLSVKELLDRTKDAK